MSASLLSDLQLGFSVALSLQSLASCLLGGLMGTLIGVLPGLGPIPTIAMLLPLTYHLPPEAAIIMLAGIYYGAQYGGSTTAILVNMPGESSSVITCLDGNAMARKGRAGSALTIAALASLFAGTVSTLLIAVVSKPLAQVAMMFGPAEYFLLMMLGLLGAVIIARGALVPAYGMVLLGLLTSCIGLDPTGGTQRYMFGAMRLADGVNFAAVAIGFFGIADMIRSRGQSGDGGMAEWRVGSLYPSSTEMREAVGPTLRGTAIGSILGILPGGGAALGSFAAYAAEVRISKQPGRFGKGAVAGLAAPEAANNAGAQTSFIPMLALGLPSNAVMALLIGALMIQGITPGPQLAMSSPRLFWGLIASMWVGNLMLVVLNLPLIGIWVQLLRVPFRVLLPILITTSAIGVLSLNNDPVDIRLLALFACLGWLLSTLRLEPAPFLLALILGSYLEENLVRAMMISQGSVAALFDSWISKGLAAACAILLLLTLSPSFRKTRDQAFTDE